MQHGSSNVVALPLGRARTPKAETAELTPQTIKGLKPGNQVVEIKDGKYPLRLLVYPSGKKSFQFRIKRGGKSIRETLGQFPAMTLQQARVKALALAATGGEELVEKRAAKTAEPVPPAMTVSDAFSLYMEAEGNALRTAKERWRLWARDIEPTLGAKPLAEVDRNACSDLIEKKLAGGTPMAARDIHRLLSKFFKWCTRKGWGKTKLEHSPMANVELAVADNVRERWLEPWEIALFFRARGRVNQFGPIFEMLLRTGARRADIFDLTWSMVEEDWLDIPHTKNGNPFIVPLLPSIRALLPNRPENAKPSDPVWSVGKTAYSHAIDRLRVEMSRLAEKDGVKIEHWTLHDFRRTIFTNLRGVRNEKKMPLIPMEILDKLLNHVDGTVRKHYDKFGYFDEKQEALRIWNEMLDKIETEALRNSG